MSAKNNKRQQSAVIAESSEAKKAKITKAVETDAEKCYTDLLNSKKLFQAAIMVRCKYGLRNNYHKRFNH